MAGTRRLAAIMFTDMVGSTGLAQRDEALALEVAEEHRALVRQCLTEHHGREIKTLGDGFLAEFPSALDAVDCGMRIQEGVRARSARVGERRRFELRVGIHLGDVVESGTDIAGDAVNVASRIEALAEPGGVAISEPVYVQVRRKVPYDFERLPTRTLKGVEDPLEVYRVGVPSDRSGEAAPDRGPPRLAVLPLANISPEASDEYLADGLTEELIAVLSRIRGLRVIARTSVSQYKSTSKSVSQIGKELGVSSILEGSVRKAGPRLRITLQLIDVPSQEHAWSETYNREMGDVFGLQAEIAEATARALRVELLGHEREALRRPPTDNLDAYGLYLQGLHASHRPHTLGYAEATSFFERAVRADPEFAEAYSAAADMHLSALGFYAPAEVVRAKAGPLIARALELSPRSSSAHRARGNYAMQLDHDWDTAEREFRTALELNPSDAAAHGWYASLLRALQRFPEQLEHASAAARLDPLDLGPASMIVFAHASMGQYEAAVAAGQHLATLSPQIGHDLLAWVYARAGRPDEARTEARRMLEELARARDQEPSSDAQEMYDSIEAMTKARVLGTFEEARRLIARWEAALGQRYVPLGELAGLHLLVGDTERALELLERDTREGDRNLWFLYQRSTFDGVRNDPRFVALLRELRLPLEQLWAPPPALRRT